MSDPQTPPSTVELVATTAQAIRELNHRTRGPDAFPGPAELYRLVTELVLLVDGLPQLLNQLGRWLHAEHDADRVRSDNHAEPGPTVSRATAHLADAGGPRTGPLAGPRTAAPGPPRRHPTRPHHQPRRPAHGRRRDLDIRVPPTTRTGSRSTDETLNRHGRPDPDRSAPDRRARLDPPADLPACSTPPQGGPMLVARRWSLHGGK